MTPSGPSPAFPFVAEVAFQEGDIVFATDRFGCVVYWNKEAEAISGYKVEEVLGKSYALACRIEPDVAALDLSAILAGRDFAGAVRCHSRGGGDVVLYLFATAGRDPAGESAGVVFVGRDVTGLWRAEEAARASADKYRVLFENNLDSVAIADRDGRVLEANPTCLRLYGYTADDIKGTNLVEVVAPEDRGAAADAMANLAAGRLVTKTIRMRRKDGTTFVVDLVASVMVVGGERRIMSVTRDVTARVRAEQARSQSERMYRAVFESANDAVFVESVDGQILDVNRNGCELLGYGKEELVKRNVSDLVPPDARAWLPHVTDAILRDKTFRTEAVNVHKSGRHIPVEISASTMELDGKTVVLAILRDISERKRAERVLRESEEKFRSVSEQSPNMIFINRRGQVVYANQKSADVMGYTREEFYSPGFDFMQLIAPESVEQIKAVYARHARGEEAEPYEYALVTKNGRRIESIITTKLIEYEGTEAILGIVTDITERKAGEQALRESEQNFREMAENSADGVAVADENGRYIYVNFRMSEMLGYPVERLIEMGFRELLTPADRDVLDDRYARRMRGETMPSGYELTAVRADGQMIPLEVSVARTTWRGRPASLTSLRDVAARRAAEQALRESEENFRALAENASDGVTIGDERGKHVFVNRRAAEMLGYPVEQLLGMTFRDLVPPGERQMLEERFARRLHGEEVPSHYELTIVRRDGSAAPVEVGVSQTKWHGRPAVMVMLREVAERKRAEQALAASEERYRNLAESSPDGIAVYQNGVVVLANRASAELLGYKDGADLVGRRAASLVRPDDLPRVEERGELLRAGGTATGPLMVEFLTRKGDSIPAEVVGAITTWRGKPAIQIMVRALSARPS